MGEYAFIVAIIVIALLGTVYLFGLKVSDRFTNVNTVLEKVQDPEELSSLVNGGYAGDPENAPYPILWGIGSHHVQDNNVSVTPSFRQGTKETDLLIAFVMHRGTLTTPSGWTLNSTEFVNNNDINQRLSILSKKYTNSDGTDVTFTQSPSGRMIGTVVTVKGKDVDIQSLSNTKGSSVLMPGTEMTASEDYTLVLSAATTPYVGNNNQPTDIVAVFPTSTHTLLSPWSVKGNRMGVAAAWGQYQGDTVKAPIFVIDGVDNNWTTTTLTVR